eukprot:TRINITY_DN11475_c0_g2_i1.p1 TRINITY_DN11475_c0_g2~~TRINITY_DN11475_c0_g2_i1.p1  ORF type:complete len:102 (+),score=24.91 TRINITY_DN11475_c0_g2_i1:54-359(+)
MGCCPNNQKGKVLPVIIVSKPGEAAEQDASIPLHNISDSRIVEVDSLSLQCDWLDEYEMHESIGNSLAGPTRNLSNLPVSKKKGKSNTNLASNVTAGTRNS